MSAYQELFFTVVFRGDIRMIAGNPHKIDTPFGQVEAISLGNALADTDDEERCPVCDEPLRADNICSTDIELGPCHAACLEGVPVVDLDTGAPMDGEADTYRYGDLDISPATTQATAESDKPSPGNTITGETVRAERSDLPPPPISLLVGIKPLDWHDGYRDKRVRILQATTIGGIYQIRLLDGVTWLDFPEGTQGCCASEAAAKEAAQADHERLIRASLDSAPAPHVVAAEPVVSVKTMRLGDGRADYFVSIKVGNREVTPHVFREEYKAAYHVALFSWLLNGTDKPDLMAFDEDEWPAQATEIVDRKYQDRVAAAHHALFHDDPTDIAERLARYAEETNEVLQAFGMSREFMHQLVDYTCDRPAGEPAKEIGAALLTLTSLCVVAGYDVMACGEADLEKLQRPETIARIRAKRATRHGRGPLPGFDAPQPCHIADPSTRDCPNMKEVGGGMDGERYSCAVCGRGYFLDYEEMK